MVALLYFFKNTHSIESNMFFNLTEIFLDSQQILEW